MYNVSMESQHGDTPVLSVRDLTKRYQSRLIFEGVTFTCGPAETVIIVGQNGSGKTTLLTCIAGLRGFDAGTVKIGSVDLHDDELALRRHLAFVPDVPQFYLELTAYEHLQFVASAHQATSDFDCRAEHLLTELGLRQARDQYPHTYSRGMRQKLGLALALIRPFSLLLMDEPTSTLDGESVAWLLDRVDQLSRDGKAIVISTHDERVRQRYPALTYQLSDGRFGRLP